MQPGPHLCKLLSVGSLFPEDEHQLNAALHSCLWQGVRALGEAVETMHGYVQHGWAGRLWVADDAKKRVQRTEKRLKDRFAEVNSYVRLATYL